MADDDYTAPEGEAQEDDMVEGDELDAEFDKALAGALDESEPEPDPEPDPEDPGSADPEAESELDLLRDTVMRQASEQRAIQKELNELRAKARVVRPGPADTASMFETFGELKEEFPEADFSGIENAFAAQQQQINYLGNLQVRNQRVANERAKKSDDRRLERKIIQDRPTYLNEVQSKEFYDWQSALPQDTRDMVLSTNDPKQIGIILDRFVSETGYRSPAANEERADAAAMRDRRRAAAHGVTSRNPAAPASGAPGENVFDEEAERNRVYKNLGVA